MSTDVLCFEEVSLRFARGQRPAIRNVSFQVPEGKFTSVIGPSGCGKSTLLNLAAGLMQPGRGQVLYRGRPMSAVNTDAAYVTQDANLLPWLSVSDNIGLALKLRGVPRAERAARLAEWINRVGLNGFEDHFPRELSGGMQKRASIARALIYDPAIVLMDEPFGPLDAITRLRLQQELLDIWETDFRTVVFVTHDLTEAICLSDQVIVMSAGPGEVRAVVPVAIERPRDIAELTESAEFGRIYKELWEIVKSEIDSARI
jgi:NitT/TauT family transport system ATP-binding protein